MYPSVHQTFELVRTKMISKYTLHSALVNQWVIPDHLIAELKNHFLLQWQGSFVKDSNKHGIIEKDGTKYLVCFHKTTPHKVYSSDKVWLSFREANVEWNIPAYVLVQPVEGDRE